MPRYLKWIAWAAAALAGLCVLAVAFVYIASEVMLERSYARKPDAIVVPATQAAIAEGGHLVTVAGCADCHGGKLSGKQLPVPGSTVYCPNLTLLATLSNADIDGVLRQAIMPDGKSVIAMPSHDYAAFTGGEAAAIIAYLRSLKPQGAPTPALSFGLLLRMGMLTGDFKSEQRELATPKPPIALGSRFARGRHLAQTICSTCHGGSLDGESNPVFTTPDLVLVAAYERRDFHTLMRTGKAAGGREVGFMSLTARQYFSHFTDAEVDALYDYLAARGKVLTAAPPKGAK